MASENTTETKDLKITLQDVILGMMREVTGLSEKDLKLNTTFEEINLESLAITAFISKLEANFKDISRTFIFDCRHVHDVCDYLIKHHAHEVELIVNSKPKQNSSTDQIQPEIDINDTHSIAPPAGLNSEPWPEIIFPDGQKNSDETTTKDIAIIGMHGRFPEADNLDQFWENLLQGKNSITEIPETRWPLNGFFEEGTDTRKTGKSYAKWGGFINDIDLFDPQFFGISAREAIQMDPQERIFLESAWHAMENAALFGERTASVKSKRGLDIGVFVGITTNTYSLLTGDNWKHVVNEVPAAVPWSSANRVSFALNLTGPSVAIDTACSSSLVALHQACTSILQGECKAAIAGGVNLYLHPAKYIQLCQLQMLSPTGRCCTYGKEADGFVPGEGVGSVVLKSLAQALEDNDQILGVIKGTSVNHCGKTNGYTVPNALSQISLIESSLSVSDIPADSITCIEAHGTGTKLGDPIEFTALNNTLSGNNTSQRCSIASVKSNIGHLESAAGIAGVVKVLLQLKHKKITSSLWSDQLNPALKLDDTRFFVPQENYEWEPDKKTGLRRAGISSFGAGGTNGHVIIEQAPKQVHDGDYSESKLLAFPLSARSAEQLELSLSNLLPVLKLHSDDDKYDFYSLAYTLQCGRQHQPYRCICLAKSFSELVKTIQDSIVDNQTKPFEQGFMRSHIRTDEVTNMIEKSTDMQVMAEKWINGEDVCWKDAWPICPGIFTKLTPYPFDRSSYWISSSPDSITLPVENNQQKNHGDSNKSFSFTGKEYFLEDHQIDGAPIFPAAAFIDYFFRAGLENHQQPSLTLENITWSNPFRPIPDQKNTIIANIDQNNNLTTIEFSSNNKKTLCRADYITKQDKNYISSISLEDAKRICQNSVDIKSSYNLFDSLDMQYGHSFQCMHSAWVSDDKQTALVNVIRQNTHKNLEENTVVEPGQLDGIFQSSIIFSLLEDSEITNQFIPYSIKSFSLVHTLPEQVWVLVKPHHPPVEHWQTFDLCVFDENGEILLKIDEFRLRIIQHKAKRPRLFNENSENHDLHTYLPIWKQVELNNSNTQDVDETILVFDRNKEFSNTLFEYSNHIYCVIPSKQFVIRNDRVIEMNENDPKHLELLWKMFRAEGVMPNSVLLNLYPRSEIDIKPNKWEAILGLDQVRDSIEILRHLINASHTRFHLQINLYHPIEHSINSQNNAIAGFMRALHEELPGVSVNIVRSVGEIAIPDHQKRFLLEYQYASRDGVQEIKWHKQQRFIKQIVHHPVQKTPEHDRTNILNKGDVVVVTGGMGAIASALIDQISLTPGISIALIGRTSENEKIQNRIEYLLSKGINAAYWVADCSNKIQIQETLNNIRKKFGSISAVFHSAGGLKDAYFLKQKTDDWEYVVKSKTLGAFYLDELTASDPIKWFLVCGGMAGERGNVGQSLYGLANAWLDEFIEKREFDRMASLRHGVSKCIAWSLWDTESGMKPPKSVIDRFAKKGLTPIPETKGVNYFNTALNIPAPIVIPIHGEQYAITNFLKSQAIAESKTLKFSPVKKRKDTKKESSARITQDNQNITKTVTKIHESKIQKKDPVDILLTYLIEILSAVSGTEKNKIDADISLEVFGLDSILVMEMNELLRKDFPELSKTVLFEARNLRMLAQLLIDEHEQEVEDLISKIGISNDGEDQNYNEEEQNTFVLDESINEISDEESDSFTNSNESSSDITNDNKHTNLRKSFNHIAKGDRIAIVGIAGRYPGAKNLDQLWQHLSRGDDLITDIPGRWNSETNEQHNQHMYAKWGGFIDDFDCFDPLFFGISPRDAERMDPQERIFLQTAWHTIENAGYTPESLTGGRQGTERKRVGVIVGVMYGEYQLYSADDSNTDTITNSSYSSIANRVSYCLDLDGPSFAIDSMCSSSLTSISLACDQLRNGRADAVIAGGVNLSIHPHKYRILCELDFASSDGRCRSFGEGGDGYVPGEGVGAVLLKRLEDAEHDQDHIYAIIQGSDIAHGAKTSGYTVPNTEAQAEVISRAFERANVNPNRLSYVEAHGTGTSLGDPIEVRGLTKALKTKFDRDQKCPIGSIKSNIGHLESAAGIAALSKVVLQLQHKKLVPSIHSDELNSNINFSTTPFYVQKSLEDWQSIPGQPLTAAISSFGAGGSNAHIVIQEHINTSNIGTNVTNDEKLVFLSSRSEQQLIEQIEQLIEFFASQKYFDLDRQECVIDTAEFLSDKYFTFHDVVNTLRFGRRQHKCRLVFSCHNFQHLYKTLQQYLQLSKTSTDYVQQLARHKIYYRDIDSDNEFKVMNNRNELMNHAVAWLNQELDCTSSLSVNNEKIRWRKVPLPGYVFVRNRYWFEQKHSTTNETSKTKINDAQEINSNNQKNVINLSPKAILDRVSKGEMDHDEARAYLEALQQNTGNI